MWSLDVSGALVAEGPTRNRIFKASTPYTQSFLEKPQGEGLIQLNSHPICPLA